MPEKPVGKLSLMGEKKRYLYYLKALNGISLSAGMVVVRNHNAVAYRAST
jgi:hypothetical protein